MIQFLRKPINLFFALVVLLLLIFFLFPINLFDGEIVLQQGIQNVTLPRPLSLSYFIGIGYDPKDMDIVKDFYLVPKGYAMAAIFILGIPALAAYRLHLGKNRNINN